MLLIDVGEFEFFDANKELFINTKPMAVRLEHSLISISKWESKWEKPYLASATSSQGFSMGPIEEMSYIRCMMIGEYPEYVATTLFASYRDVIQKYINKLHTATRIFRTSASPPSKKIITSELIYFWMIDFGIPFECEKWHLNRLLMLIDVCNVSRASAQGKNKMTAAEYAKYKRELNEQRLSARK